MRRSKSSLRLSWRISTHWGKNLHHRPNGKRSWRRNVAARHGVPARRAKDYRPYKKKCSSSKLKCWMREWLASPQLKCCLWCLLGRVCRQLTLKSNKKRKRHRKLYLNLVKMIQNWEILSRSKHCSFLKVWRNILWCRCLSKSWML